MKSVLRISNMNTSNDAARIRSSISGNEGVIAFYIDKEKMEVEVIYDDKFLDLDDMIDSMEKLGYIII